MGGGIAVSVLDAYLKYGRRIALAKEKKDQHGRSARTTDMSRSHANDSCPSFARRIKAGESEVYSDFNW
jgi:hypothetical protein